LPINIPAWFFLGGWFLYQFFERNYALVQPSKTGGSGVASFAHVGGFIFGVVLTRVAVGDGRITVQEVCGPTLRGTPTPGGEQTLAPATITFLTIPTTATRRAGDRWSYQSSPDSGSRMVSVAGDLAISPVRLIGFRGPLEQIATSIALAVAVQRRSARATWIGWNSSSTDFCPRWISLCIIGVGTLIERPDVDGNENRPGLVILTCIFLVELPGIEPGSYGIPSRLLRAQFAMPLLGSPDHANKSG
jgi:hypothetical protein